MYQTFGGLQIFLKNMHKVSNQKQGVKQLKKCFTPLAFKWKKANEL